MFFKTATSAFLLPESAPLTLDEAVAAAGLEDPRPLSPEELPGLGMHGTGDEARLGEWPVVGPTWARWATPRLLELFFRGAAIGETRAETDVPLADDPLRPLADRFRAAVIRLAPEAAWIDGAMYYGDEAWANRQGSSARNRELAELAIAADADALLAERLTLLYLDETLASLATAGADDARDELPISSGRVVFGHGGARRWL